jgi:putative membrane protein
MSSTAASRIHFSKNLRLQLYLLLLLLSWTMAWIFNIDPPNFYVDSIVIVVVLALLIFTYRYFRFSNLSYGFFFVFLLLHVYGAQYAYTATPLGEWLQNTWSLARNPYDRIVHFCLGFLLAWPMKDWLINKMEVPARNSNFLSVMLILAIAAFFELAEWAIADVLFPAKGQSFVTTQGDMWDSQKDIFLALAGAIIQLLLLGWWKRKAAY